MDGKGPEHPLSDAALDRELESALGIEPSPEFLARVRTRIAAEPAVTPWRLAHVMSGFSRTKWVLEPLVGAAFVGIVLALVIPRWTRDALTVAPPQPKAKTEMAAASSPAVPTVTAPPRGSSLRPDRHQETNEPAITRVRMSEPVFSDADRRALEILVTAVAEGRVPPLPAAPDVAPKTDGINEMRIEPLVIDPLPQLARAEDRGDIQ